ncbi:AraC family transcriptional regulator [Leeia oryzae]|uniref:AraC family transcriptional regulator n=1 Tax=Leeia oryzae TaxID=356662 RepID=UPI000371F1EC|nr:AraC family transcriptional regulator [Leeia oryzae]
MQPGIVKRDEVGITARITQYQPLELTRLYISHPVLILVAKGEKTVRWPGGEFVIHTGGAVAIAGGQTLDITNRGPEGGQYEAYWLVWDDALLKNFVRQHSATTVQPIHQALPMAAIPDGFHAACERAVQAICDDAVPVSIAQHHMNEVLLWLMDAGGLFSMKEIASTSHRVRNMISQQPAHNWAAPDVAETLAMSEATLRRKLAAEHTRFSDLLLDVRMSCAIQLLQSTTIPVTRIAQEVGYDSSSHFSDRFRQRFGFSPSALRRSQAD